MNYNELFYLMKQFGPFNSSARNNDSDPVYNQLKFLTTSLNKFNDHVYVLLWTINYLRYNCYEL